MTNAALAPTSRRAARQATRAAGARVTGELLAPAATQTRASRRRLVGRTAVLGALAAITIVAPLAGANATTTASANPAVSDGLVGALADGAVELPEATALSHDPSAQARAVTAASRAHVREAMECAVQSDANGTLSAAMGGSNVAPELLMPVAAGTYRVTSTYGPRSYPFPGMHEGTDYAGDVGTPLYAVADGTIVYAGGGRDGRSGQIVILRAEVGGGTYDFWYGHMFTNGVHVSEGQEVTAGQQIASIGNNGNSTGPHVHFEVHDANDATVDPAAFLAQHGAVDVAEAARCA